MAGRAGGCRSHCGPSDASVEVSLWVERVPTLLPFRHLPPLPLLKRRFRRSPKVSFRPRKWARRALLATRMYRLSLPTWPLLRGHRQSIVAKGSVAVQFRPGRNGRATIAKLRHCGRCRAGSVGVNRPLCGAHHNGQDMSACRHCRRQGLRRSAGDQCGRSKVARGSKCKASQSDPEGPDDQPTGRAAVRISPTLTRSSSCDRLASSSMRV